jgi:HK97 family phage prohead protease
MKGLRFAGYAALFDKADRRGDVIRRGAFARAVADGPARLPLLWQHQQTRPIGRIEAIAEDARGLRVIGRLSPGAGTDAAALLRDGAVGGLSFGYRVRAGRGVPPGREITDVDLVEVSLVTFPMQPGARVHAIHEEDME